MLLESRTRLIARVRECAAFAISSARFKLLPPLLPPLIVTSHILWISTLPLFCRQSISFSEFWIVFQPCTISLSAREFGLRDYAFRICHNGVKVSFGPSSTIKPRHHAFIRVRRHVLRSERARAPLFILLNIRFDHPEIEARLTLFYITYTFFFMRT